MAKAMEIKPVKPTLDEIKGPGGPFVIDISDEIGPVDQTDPPQQVVVGPRQLVPIHHANVIGGDWWKRSQHGQRDKYHHADSSKRHYKPHHDRHRHPYHHLKTYPYMHKMVGGCSGTEYGCCADGVTSRLNSEGSNCSIPMNVSCKDSRFGCCWDGTTFRENYEGTNCPSYAKHHKHNIPVQHKMGGNKRDKYGCLIDGGYQWCHSANKCLAPGVKCPRGGLSEGYILLIILGVLVLGMVLFKVAKKKNFRRR